MPRKLPELSRAEWLVMNLCWENGKATARQIYEQALREKTWNYQTVKTMLDRLTTKGYLKREKLGPLCLYQALVAREGVVDKTIGVFWNTVLGSTFTPLFAHLAKSKKLSKGEIESLKTLIQEHEEDKRP